MCYEGSHGGAAAAAWLAMVFLVVGFPLGSTVKLLYSRKRWGRTGSADAWGYLLRADYIPRYFWFKQLQLGLLFVLGFGSVVLSDPRNASPIGSYYSVYV